MSTPLCLGCGAEVRLNKDREWATEDGSTVCPGGTGGHRVEQIIPDRAMTHLAVQAPPTEPELKAGDLR